MDIESLLALHDRAQAGEGLEQGDMDRLTDFYRAMGSPRNEAELALAVWSYQQEVTG